MTKFDNSEAREKRLDENAIHAFAAQLDGKDFYKIPINNAWNYWGEKNICIYLLRIIYIIIPYIKLRNKKTLYYIFTYLILLINLLLLFNR